MLALVLALRPAAPPGGPRVPVQAAARDLAAGSPLRPGDLVQRLVPAADVPEGALRSPPASDRTVALPVRRGEVVTDVRLVGPSLVSALGPGLVAAPVRLADPATARLARAGDTVDVLAAGEDGRGGTVADGVRVLAGAPPEVGGVAARSATPDAVLVLAVTPATAAALARAGAVSRLSIVLRPVGAD